MLLLPCTTFHPDHLDLKCNLAFDSKDNSDDNSGTAHANECLRETLSVYLGLLLSITDP